MKYSFKNDYSEGAHPAILEAINRTNFEQHEGYGEDHFCGMAVDLIREKVDDPHADIHFVPSGTHANSIIIGAMLKPYESVIAAETGHINVHEAGAIENRGHKVTIAENEDGKLSCESIQKVLDTHEDEHMVLPRLVYLSNTTETGMIYTHQELKTISQFCRANDLFLFLDGARIGCALTAPGNDLTLGLVNNYVDVFYIGGTKNGAFMGEAVVIRNDRFKKNFRYHLKQNGALVSKSRLFGLQFIELFKSDLYFTLATHANKMAETLSTGIREQGFKFLNSSVTNQIFPVLPNTVIDRLEKKFGFYVWSRVDDTHSAVRLVTSWATHEHAVRQFVLELEKAVNK